MHHHVGKIEKHFVHKSHIYISGNGIGDVCRNDSDNDTVPNYLDNCPNNSKIFSTDFRFVLLVQNEDVPLWSVQNIACAGYSKCTCFNILVGDEILDGRLILKLS
jgi:hypothetical protein